MTAFLSRRQILRAAGAAAVSTPFLGVAAFADADALAVGGYDVVNYFTADAAAKGSAAHVATYAGRSYRFVSADNKAAFEADPDRYAPKYNGHCAWAASRGYLASGDPEAWTVWNDRLYLNYNKQVRTRWREDIPGNVAKADRNWPELSKKS